MKYPMITNYSYNMWCVVILTHCLLLQIILAFGNYMNSSRRGAVYGFKLESLGRVWLTCIIVVVRSALIIICAV